MNRRFTSMAALVALATLFAAWSAGGASGAASSTVFTYASQNSIVTNFDPATSYSNESIALANIYEQLTRYDAKTKTVKPLLATSLEGERQGHDVDVHPAQGRQVPHRPRAHGAGRQGRHPADDQAQGRRCLHLGCGQVDRDSQPADARVPSQVPGAARHHLVVGLRRVHLRHARPPDRRTWSSGSAAHATPAPART